MNDVSKLDDNQTAIIISDFLVRFPVPVTPTVELNTLAMKRCESATYTFITDQQMRIGSSSQQSAAAKFAHKRFY
jgi:hypothetical protein